MRISAVAALLSSVLSAGCSVFGIRTVEEPRFTVIDHVGAVEIRRYDARTAAETSVTGTALSSRNVGFQRLAGYIFGGNTAKTSIAMTAPVAQSGKSQTIDMTAPVSQTRGADGTWVIRFFLPASLTAADAPVPNDPKVSVVTVPPETYAVLRYSGSIAPEAVAEASANLMKGLAGSKWQPQGEPVAWFYDPPWTLPPLRRNEAAVPVTDGATR
jgi:hypothetical protein